MGIYGRSANGTSGLTGAAGNGGQYSFQLAGGSSNPINPGDGISVILRTSTFGTPQPVGEIITNYFTVANADYAEYFEWDDGNIYNDDRVGYFVELNADKIRMATSSETSIGITSMTSNIMGDSAELGWSSTNMYDELGRLIREENYSMPISQIVSKYDLIYNSNSVGKAEIITDVINDAHTHWRAKANSILNEILIRDGSVPSDLSTLKYSDYYRLFGNIEGISTVDQYITIRLGLLQNELNSVLPVLTAKVSSSYDPSQQYIPRSQRKEWIPVGMLGKVYVHDNGNCVVGQRCDCSDGIAVPGTHWFVLQRSSPNTIRILYK
jgi:hypothetical protein